MVLDNLREGVLTADFYDPTLNPLYRDVLAHYGAVAMPCRVRDPDRKGKSRVRGRPCAKDAAERHAFREPGGSPARELHPKNPWKKQNPLPDQPVHWLIFGGFSTANSSEHTPSHRPWIFVSSATPRRTVLPYHLFSVFLLFCSHIPDLRKIPVVVIVSAWTRYTVCHQCLRDSPAPGQADSLLSIFPQALGPQKFEIRASDRLDF